jgi:hypothetical protein
MALLALYSRHTSLVQLPHRLGTNAYLTCKPGTTALLAQYNHLNDPVQSTDWPGTAALQTQYNNLTGLLSNHLTGPVKDRLNGPLV